MKQIEDIWLKRSIEVHRFVSPNPDEFWQGKLLKFQDEMRDCECKGYVYKKDGIVKGFITYKESNNDIYIPELFVYESGKGIGPKLLEKVNDLNKNIRLAIKVYALNIRTINWYFKKGFVIDDVRECEDDDLQDFKCEKNRFKYKTQRLKFHMVKLPQNS